MPLNGQLRVDSGACAIHKSAAGQFSVRADGKVERRVKSQLKAGGDGAITDLRQLDDFISQQTEQVRELLPQDHWKQFGGFGKAPAKTKREFKQAIAKIDEALPELAAETLPEGWTVKDTKWQELDYFDSSAFSRKLAYRPDDKTYQEVSISFQAAHRGEDGKPFYSGADKDSGTVWLTTYVEEGGSRVEQSINASIDFETGAILADDASEMLDFTPKGQ